MRRLLPPDVEEEKFFVEVKQDYYRYYRSSVFIAYCVEGFMDITLKDYGLPKFCEVRSVKCEVV